MKAEELMSKARYTATQALSRDGKVYPLVILEHKKGPAIVFDYDVQPEKKAQLQQAIKSLVNGCISVGDFLGCVHWAEAWVAPADTTTGLLPARMHPDREEIVILAAYGNDGQRLIEMYNIKREEGRVSLGEKRQRSGETYQCWLDPAFENVEA